jgi:hypothetical protein
VVVHIATSVLRPAHARPATRLAAQAWPRRGRCHCKTLARCVAERSPNIQCVANAGHLSHSHTWDHPFHLQQHPPPHRHHCRFCGRIFCARCSRFRVLESRCCLRCFGAAVGADAQGHTSQTGVSREDPTDASVTTVTQDCGGGGGPVCVL